MSSDSWTRPVAKKRRSFEVVAVLLAFASIAFAEEPIPPLPLATRSATGVTQTLHDRIGKRCPKCIRLYIRP